jgi:hypothetical protein
MGIPENLVVQRCFTSHQSWGMEVWPHFFKSIWCLVARMGSTSILQLGHTFLSVIRSGLPIWEWGKYFLRTPLSHGRRNVYAQTACRTWILILPRSAGAVDRSNMLSGVQTREWDAKHLLWRLSWKHKLVLQSCNLPQHESTRLQRVTLLKLQHGNVCAEIQDLHQLPKWVS